MVYVWLTLFLLLVIVFWSLNLLGLPGNWLIVLSAAIWAWIGPADYQFSWIVVLILLALAIVGELIEFGASVIGTRKLGAASLLHFNNDRPTAHLYNVGRDVKFQYLTIEALGWETNENDSKRLFVGDWYRCL